MTREVLFLALIACGTQGVPDRPSAAPEDVEISAPADRDPAFYSTMPNPAIVRELTECKETAQQCERKVRALNAVPCYRPPRSLMKITFSECAAGWACFAPGEAGVLLANIARFEAIDNCERERAAKGAR